MSIKYKRITLVLKLFSTNNYRKEYDLCKGNFLKFISNYYISQIMNFYILAFLLSLLVQFLATILLTILQNNHLEYQMDINFVYYMIVSTTFIMNEAIQNHELPFLFLEIKAM